MTLEWEEFLDPYIQAVGELKIKLRLLLLFRLSPFHKSLLFHYSIPLILIVPNAIIPNISVAIQILK